MAGAGEQEWGQQEMRQGSGAGQGKDQDLIWKSLKQEVNERVRSVFGTLPAEWRPTESCRSCPRETERRRRRDVSEAESNKT